LDGTVRVFLAEALILPTGLVTTAVLTRHLGTDGYGLFTLVATLVAWVEWSVTSLFARATYQRIGEAADWRPVGTTVLRLHLAASTACAVLLVVLAPPMARLLGEPALIGYLRLFAIDIPIFSLAHAHRDILIGMGGFRERALMSAGRWSARLLLIVALVGLGFSVTGAIVASIGASLVEVGIARCFIRPSLLAPTHVPSLSLLGHAAPLFLYAISMMLFDKLDLFALKTLGGSAELAGVYGVAQNLAIVPRLFALSFSPLLLSTLTRLLRDGNQRRARDMGRDGMRLVILLLPFAGMAAGAAGEIVQAVAGQRFGGAGPLLAVLIFAAVAMTMISVATAILTAAGRPGWTFAVAGPLVPMAITGHLLVIPRFGAVGAAAVTAGCAGLGALVTMGAVHRLWRIAPPAASLVRSGLMCGAAYALATLWAAGGLVLVLKLGVIMVLIAAGLLALGEFDRREIALARSLMPWPVQAVQDE
jgi:O-antigen/teichoic acid export membrane protein